MALPLPNVVADVGPGGNIVTAMGGQNALARKMLENKFYAPEMESQIANRNALTQGQQISNQYMPEQMRIANTLKQLELQMYPESQNALIQQKLAQAQQAQQKLQNPLLGISGPAGQIGAAQYVRDNPDKFASPEEAANFIQSAAQGANESKMARAEYDKRRTLGYTFTNLPVDQKSGLLAQAAGLGIQPNEAADRFMKGETIADMARSQGIDPNNLPEPIHPLTTAGRTQLKARQASLAELNNLGKKISEWAAPYTRQIMGYSPAQIKDAIKGKNKDQQAKFLAARMLAPELSAIRLKSMGGNVGIEAIREMTEKAMLNGHAFQALVSEDVYKHTNDLVEDAIKDAVNAANKVASQIVANAPKNKSKATLRYNQQTGEFEEIG